ncbi:MAG: hypothetical protein ACLUVC_02195 [Longibaculum sp.]
MDEREIDLLKKEIRRDYKEFIKNYKNLYKLDVYHSRYALNALAFASNLEEFMLRDMEYNYKIFRNIVSISNCYCGNVFTFLEMQTEREELDISDWSCLCEFIKCIITKYKMEEKRNEKN